MNLLKFLKHSVELFFIVFVCFIGYMFVGPSNVKAVVSAVTSDTEVRPTLYAGHSSFWGGSTRLVSGIRPGRLR